MEFFTDYRLVKKSDGYEVELYLNEQLNEIAQELNNFNKEEQDDLENTFGNKIVGYIKEKLLYNLEIKTIKIMLGSLLLATLPVVSIDNVPAPASKPAIISENSNKEYSMLGRGQAVRKIQQAFNTMTE